MDGSFSCDCMPTSPFVPPSPLHTCKENKNAYIILMAITTTAINSQFATDQNRSSSVVIDEVGRREKEGGEARMGGG